MCFGDWVQHHGGAPHCRQAPDAGQGNGGRLIAADPRKTEIAHLADLHVQHNLGTDVALINGMMT